MFNEFDCRLFISQFSQFAFYLSLSLSVISKSLAQPRCKYYSLSVTVVVSVWLTTNKMCVKNSTHVARTSRNKMSTTWDLSCCLVPQYEALRTCCSAFPITTKRYFDQDVKVMPGITFTKRTRSMCGSLQKRGDVVALKVWFSHAQCIKMTRDEHALGFKSCNISKYWWIWMLLFLLKQIWIGIDNFLLNFFATFDSVLGLQITVTFGSVLNCRLTLDCSNRHVGSHLLQAQCCVDLSQPNKESNRQSSTIATVIRHLTRFALLLLLRIQRYLWRIHVVTWA